jgi:2-keto-4-pentenoate hydratase
MTESDRASAAKALLAAYDDRSGVEPLIETHPAMTISDAYEIQLRQVRSWTGAGRRVCGHKVGLTSAAMRRQLGVDEPDYGHLMDDMFHLESLPIPIGGFLSPKVEPEIAFVLKAPLAGPRLTVADAISAVDYVLPALEIVDSRVRDWKISLRDTVADNASSAGVVLGSTPTPLSGLDLRAVVCELEQGGKVVDTGTGAATLGSPLNALVWLANTLGAFGVTLEAGSVIMPGSLTSAVPVLAGDTVTATFTGLGSVTAVFSVEES